MQRNKDTVKQDYTKAAKCYQRAVDYDEDVYEQQKMLGICYEYGCGVEQNFAEAMKRYNKAFRLVEYDEELEKILGIDYKFECDNSEDYVKSAVQYKKAAAQGAPHAQVMLGLYYSRPYSLEFDRDKAF